ncbi:MAG: sugar transferase [Caldicoprobacterales bacterium]|nr:sugar transferase [Clostridiales bacterium]
MIMFSEAAHILDVYSSTNRVYEIVGRISDIVISIIGLLFTLPILILFSFAIMLETKGPAVYSQIRVGKGGRLFKIYKLRSMRLDSEKDGIKWAEENDHRITKVGRVIRRMRIDEIPQLFNVLKGDMSVIGPRPERPFFTIEFNRKIPGFINRLRVKPGLTGWAQVNGGYNITPEEKFKLDMYYIENRCIGMDLLIMLKTLIVVITGEGAR